MKNKANELNGRMGKLKESVLSFKGLVGVNLISNAVTSGFTLLTSQIKVLFLQVFKYQKLLEQ